MIPNKKQWKRYSLYGIVWALMLGFAAPGGAQTVAMPPGPPDVLVLVFQRPGLGDEVGITYARTIPHTQAQRDLQALAQAGSFTPGDIHIVDGASPVRGRAARMTSVSFVAPGVIHDETHAFPLEALIQTFRGYKRLTFIFFATSRFQFQGWQRYADNHVQIAMEQHGSAYTYQVQILNAQFDQLNLPQTGTAAGATTGTRPVRRSPLALFLGVLVAAGAAGVLIFLLMTRLVAAPAKADAPDAEETKIAPKG